MFNLFWCGVEFATSWLLFLVTLDTSCNIWSNDTILTMMLKMLNHTQTYSYWYSLQFWLGQYWLHYYWLSQYRLHYYWLRHYRLGQYWNRDINSYVFFMNGFFNLYSCQDEVWTMLEELKCFAKLLLNHSLFLNMNCEYFWKCLMFTSIFTVLIDILNWNCFDFFL